MTVAPGEPAVTADLAAMTRDANSDPLVFTAGAAPEGFSTSVSGSKFSYQNFLNSLYFPVQILIRSRRVDIGPYLDRLAEIRRNQDNMLLNVLMDDYMDFIDALAQEANIMDKSFYVVVPC